MRNLWSNSRYQGLKASSSTDQRSLTVAPPYRAYTRHGGATVRERCWGAHVWLLASSILPLFAPSLFAQPSIQTELRNGVIRAVVLHPSGDPVTDDSPALPGETLTIQGAGFSAAPQLLVGGQPADSTPLDDANLQFTLPSTAGGGFLELALAAGNAATVPVDAPADPNQLTAD